YSEYKKWRAATDREAAAAASAAKSHGRENATAAAAASTAPPAGSPQKKKPSYKQLREKEALEADMQTLGARKQELETALCAPEAYKPEEIAAFSEEIGRLQTALDAAEMRWLELSEECDF
ncbi:MAG: hypothetical protein K2K51_03455, partial [Bacteroidales bacterium]|nr:hypothetical protein [Bacteroidales bacterium]